MSLPVFTPPIDPSPGTSSKPQLKLLRAEFGDGYTQTTRAGLNHIRQVVSLSWSALTGDQAGEIVGFLEERGGDQAFTYQLPNDARTRRWTCDEWEHVYLTAGFHSLVAVFRQSFDGV